MSATYDIGDVVTMQAIFTDNGEIVFPNEVTCSVKPPGRDSETANVEFHEEQGTYTAIVEPDVKGTWYYRFQGVGNYEAAEEGVFSVRRQRVT